LTNERPKPLVPIFNKPLITFAFDHLQSAGVRRFVVNTHHRPEAYAHCLGARDGRAEYRGSPVHFCHEPVLLETGGGIKNAQEAIGREPFLVYNGDVLADFPLEPLLAAHRRSGALATLALRSSGAERRIQCDSESGMITDMRGLIGGRSEPAYLFTGVSVVAPEIFSCIAPGEIVSIVPVLVDHIRRGGRVGGVVIDEGVWFDIGTVEAYLDVHRVLLGEGHLFSYLPQDWLVPIDPGASVAASARITGCSAVGAGAVIEDDAGLVDVIVWPRACVPKGRMLRNAVFTPEGVCQSLCRQSNRESYSRRTL
jgi:NDP-sugar pyrophosphorylase family protein